MNGCEPTPVWVPSYRQMPCRCITGITFHFDNETTQKSGPCSNRLIWEVRQCCLIVSTRIVVANFERSTPPKASCCCLISTEKNGTIHKTSSIVVAGFSKNPSVSVYHHFRKLLCLATQGHMKLSLNNPIYNSLILQLETSVRNKNKTHFWDFLGQYCNV